MFVSFICFVLLFFFVVVVFLKMFDCLGFFFCFFNIFFS